MNIKIAVGILAGFVLGLLAHIVWSTTSTSSNLISSDDKKLESVRQQLQALSEEDFAEYLQLKSMKEKYEKADEILGKILVLMISDFGIRNSQAQLDKLKERIISESEDKDINNSTVASGIAPDPSPTNDEIEKPSNANQSLGKTSANDLKKIQNEKELSVFLKSVEVSDFKKIANDSDILAGSRMKNLVGSYVGVIRLNPSNGFSREWDVNMSIHG